MISRISIVFLILFCTSCRSDAQQFIVYQQGAVLPEVVADKGLEQLTVDFVAPFQNITGVKPVVVLKPSEDAKSLIYLKLTPQREKEAFTITQKDNALTIEGNTPQSLIAAIAYFFAEYAGRLPVGTAAVPVKQILVPQGLTYAQTPAFEYREPYFPDNFKPEFLKWNNTHTLEETWALWGHNIGKAVKITPAMYAQIDGEQNTEQLCFSAPELEQALSGFINKQVQENPLRSNFMVMPQDNDLVCMCDRCKAKGNSKTNASPAVFSLLNKLAKQFPKQQFFSTAYITTQLPPQFKLEPNAGVMVSTMAFPKGVVIERSAASGTVKATFSAWKKVTDKIYLWDYAINFDNYFDAYPTLKIAQQNLKYYQQLGVTGVFMQGSEDRYSTFADVKAYVYAQLLQNPNIDVDKYIRLFFESKYPAVSSLLYDYYLNLENKALESVKVLDIYGGIIPSIKKYLDDAKLTAFYKALADKAATLTPQEQQQLNPLLASLAFQRLEVMRVNAFEDNGYGIYNYKEGTATVKPDVKQLLDNLSGYAAKAGISVYNESGATVAEYINAWEKDIINVQYKNLLYAKRIKSRFEPDEDYPDIKMLNDCNVGFGDYYNNWFISPKKNIIIEVDAADVTGAGTLEMTFLEDRRHNIYAPEKVVVTFKDKRYEAKVVSFSSYGKIVKCRAVMPVQFTPADGTIIIEAVRQNINGSIACDEIFFK
jgi:hypothetical protein